MHNKNYSEYGKENIKMKDNDTAIEQTVFFFRWRVHEQNYRGRPVL
jgi:hypothetical protein